MPTPFLSKNSRCVKKTLHSIIFLLGLPIISVQETRSLDGIPNFHIQFPDGHTDTFVLDRFYSSDQDRMVQRPHCNYFGHLAKDTRACVAVTGCYGIEPMEFTINSKHSGSKSMYVLKTDGTLEALDSVFKVRLKLL